MLRLDYFLMRSGLVVDGDVFVNGGFTLVVGSNESARYVNSLKGREEGRAIKSFASRSNKGKQPVPSNVPVIVTYDSGDKWRDPSNCFDWGLSETHDNVKSWKPDREKLIEQQKEYDAQQKPMANPIIGNFKIYHGMVSDDTIKSWGGAPNTELPIEELMLNTKESTMKKQGDEVVIIYNDLIGSGRKEAIGTYQMETDKEILILDENGIFEVIDKEWFVEYALTDEQEMELAKEKQIESISALLSDKGYGRVAILLRCLQENNLLAEVVLPLRG